jgi:hypothetical protein
LVLAELDLAGARKKRLTEFADVLADRRPEMYGGVVEAARDKAAR